jgi:hypothetical protein
MSFFTNLRADRLVTEIRSATDPASPARQKAIARLKDVGAGAIEPVLGALPEADKSATLAFVEVLTALVNQKTFPVFVRGLIEGSPRVISGISWALTNSKNYPHTMLLEALTAQGVSKSSVLDVIAAQKSRFNVRELLTAAYAQEPNEKASLGDCRARIRSRACTSSTRWRALTLRKCRAHSPACCATRTS